MAWFRLTSIGSPSLLILTSLIPALWMSMDLNDVYTGNATIAGSPAISIPAGDVEDGGSRLPIGLHLQAPAFEDARLLRAAATIESMLAG